MRQSIIAVFIFLALLMTFGCSQTSGLVTPDIDAPKIPDDGEDGTAGGHVLWGYYSLNIDPSTGDLSWSRDADATSHYNITQLITPPACNDCISITVFSFDPITREMILVVTLKNPSVLTARDIRGIVMVNGTEHKLLNPDDYTKLYSPNGQPQGFIAFRKSEDYRKFQAGVIDTQYYMLYIPKPPNYGAIGYAVDASWPGNCNEPYQIHDQQQLNPMGESPGASCTIRVGVDDWQGDVSYVAVDTTILGGGFVDLSYITEQGVWEGTIENVSGLGLGKYELLISAGSDSPCELYDYITIEVTKTATITDVEVTYQNSQKTTWKIFGSDFGGQAGTINTDLPSGWTTNIDLWTDTQVLCTVPPYSMDVLISLTTFSGMPSNQYLVREADSILVIYNINSEVSGQVKDYYADPVTGRGIPAEHILPLDAPDAETISRETYNSLKTTIEDWLTTNEVRYEVKYIVTCKGVPLRIENVNGSGTGADFACVDSELCLLYESYEILGRKSNPYYQLSTPQVFHPGKFAKGGLTARYLVTRLTGYSYEEVTGMIDRCKDPYQGGDGWYILDDDPDIGYDYMPSANSLMVGDGLNTYFDNTDVFVTAATIADPSISDHVMGYCGHGIHHSPNPGEWYIINDLQFTYLNGALFNSYESFNGTTFIWENHSGHGMVGDFIRMGGSGGIGHVYEPYSDGVGDERVLYRWYARGYGLAEAQYMACRYMSWTEVVVGEPLCHIATWGE